MTRVVTAKIIERGIAQILSDRAVIMSTESDVMMRATIFKAVWKEATRPIWTQDQGECYLTLWDMLRSRLPRWAWKIVGVPKKESRLLQIYHACPHLRIDPLNKHLEWLIQDQPPAPSEYITGKKFLANYAEIKTD